MAKVSPWTGSKDLPPLEMKPLRRLVLQVWRMELAREGLLCDGYEPVYDPLREEPDSEIPLDGLAVKLVDMSLHVSRILKLTDELIDHEDWQNDPLCLVRHSQLLGKPPQ